MKVGDLVFSFGEVAIIVDASTNLFRLYYFSSAHFGMRNKLTLVTILDDRLCCLFGNGTVPAHHRRKDDTLQNLGSFR